MRRAAWAAGMAVLMAGAAILARASLPPVALAEQWLADYRLARLAPPEPMHPDIVVAAVTEDTLRLFPYRSPLDREFLARVVKMVEAKGARAIGIDMLFDQPTEEAKDDALRAALASLTIPARVSFAGQAEGLSPEQAVWLSDFVAPGQRGLANLAKDPLDDTVRWIYPGRDGQPGLVPALAGDVSDVPLPAGLAPIHWRRAEDGPAFRTIPAHVLAVVPDAWVRGKIVLIGSDVTLVDRHRTPFSAGAADGAETMSGIHVHAHALATLLDRRSGGGLGASASAALVLAAAAAGALMALASVPFALRLAGAMALVAGSWAAAFLAVRQGGPMVPLVTPTLAFALATWGMEVVGHRDTQRHRRFIKQAFAQYISPQLVEQLARDPSALRLSGEKREMTFLFTDLAGFTSLAEHMPPEQVTALLNEYLDGICETVLAQGGTITDFIGDAVFATFGAPVPQADHRERAIACTRAAAAFSETFQARYAGLGMGHTRMGVHTGTVTIGNIGSRHRFKYSPVGDAVNTASRLEGLNKYFGTRVCISGPALPQAERAYARFMGAVVLKGRHEPLDVYELLERTPEAAERAQAWNQAFPAAIPDWAEDGLAAFHRKRAQAGEDLRFIVMADK